MSPIGLNVTTEEDGVVTMIDLEEIDLSAALSTTSARRIRAGKKFACEDICKRKRTKYSQLEAVTGSTTW